jgi:S-adenosylmethionine synthetase
MDFLLRPLAGGAHEDDVEVVEHKGVGHPDTMCDALAESFGVALARYYLERFGTLLHFNVDKALLVGGASQPAFRGGTIVTPMEIFLAGRAAREVRGVKVPVDEIAIETGKAWVRKHMHALDPERHIAWHCLARGGSSDLVDLFLAHRPESGVPWLANDTSIGAGYAPATRLDRVVLAAATRLRELAHERPEVGEDIKVMGVRRRDRIDLTVACAFIGEHLVDLADYAAQRKAVARDVAAAAEVAARGPVTVAINAADDMAVDRVYLTVTGTSAESGDDGQVGRGNRVNGLITPYRPMSLEAAAGKNPASHVGKLYNVAAHRIASALVERIPEVAEAHCYLLSRIGTPIHEPAFVDVRIRTHDHLPSSTVHKRVEEIVRQSLASLGTLAEEILKGGVRMF